MPTAEEARENRARRRVILDNQRFQRRIAIAREADERRNSEEAMNRAELPRTLWSDSGTYRDVPYTDLTTGETGTTRVRVRIPFEDVKYDIKRADRERKLKRRAERQTQQDLIFGPIYTYQSNRRENIPEIIDNSFRTFRNLRRRREEGEDINHNELMGSYSNDDLRHPTIRNTARVIRPPRDTTQNRFSGTGLKTGNAWINHVRNFAKENKMSYWDAIKNPKCKASYK